MRCEIEQFIPPSLKASERLTLEQSTKEAIRTNILSYSEKELARSKILGDTYLPPGDIDKSVDRLFKQALLPCTQDRCFRSADNSIGYLVQYIDGGFDGWSLEFSRTNKSFNDGLFGLYESIPHFLHEAFTADESSEFDRNLADVYLDGKTADLCRTLALKSRSELDHKSSG